MSSSVPKDQRGQKRTIRNFMKHRHQSIWQQFGAKCLCSPTWCFHDNHILHDFFQWAFSTNWSHGKKSAILDGKKM